MEDSKTYVVKFDFELSPIDAENFADLFRQNKCRLLEKIIDATVNKYNRSEEDKDSQIKWYKRHIAYMEEIEEKVIGSSKVVVPLKKIDHP